MKILIRLGLREQAEVGLPSKKSTRDSNPLGIETQKFDTCCDEVQQAEPVLIYSSEIKAIRCNTSEWGGK